MSPGRTRTLEGLTSSQSNDSIPLSRNLDSGLEGINRMYVLPKTFICYVLPTTKRVLNAETM